MNSHTFTSKIFLKNNSLKNSKKIFVEYLGSKVIFLLNFWVKFFFFVVEFLGSKFFCVEFLGSKFFFLEFLVLGSIFFLAKINLSDDFLGGLCEQKKLQKSKQIHKFSSNIW